MKLRPPPVFISVSQKNVGLSQGDPHSNGDLKG
jgi:hypothetical protein